MVQITDKEISTADLDKSIKYTTDKLLRIDIDKPEDDILKALRKTDAEMCAPHSAKVRSLCRFLLTRNLPKITIISLLTCLQSKT